MIYLFLSSIVWAFSYGLIKGNLTHLNPDFVAWTRMIIPALLFFPFFKGKELAFKTKGLFLCIGALQYGLMYLLVIRSYAYLSAYQVIFFTAFTPIYVILIDDLLIRRFRPFYLFTALLAFMGAGILYYQSLFSGQLLKGFLLVQASDICFAFGQVAYKRLRKKESSLKDLELYALLFWGATAITTLSTSFFGGWSSIWLLSSKQLLLILYLGAVASGLCFFWWNRSAVFVSSGTLAALNNIKIPLGVFVSIVVFGEEAPIRALTLSTVLISISIFLAEAHSREKLSFFEAKKRVGK